jgi:hypothetical protein
MPKCDGKKEIKSACRFSYISEAYLREVRDALIVGGNMKYLNSLFLRLKKYMFS